MWIKNKSASLYVTLLLRMFLSTFISVILFLTLVGVAHYFQQSGGISLIASIKMAIFSEAHHISAGIFAIMAFCIMSFRIISKIVSYIKVIEDGIKKLPDHNITYSIPVMGTHELARLAQSVNDIKEELRQKTHAERAHELHRRMLITNISHDLRTPLTSVIGYLDLAKTNISPNHEAYSYLEIAERNSLRLKKLISDLFLYSKIISNDLKMHVQEVNLKILLSQIIDLKPYPITFIAKPEKCMVFVDVKTFHRVMDNLFDNAHKYAVTDSEIVLEVFQTEKEIIIEIRNEAKENMASMVSFLTTRLYTADKKRNESSSGLGLSIVSELMKKMQGKLQILFDEKEKIFTARVTLANELTK